jgi:hypothetical protein
MPKLKYTKELLEPIVKESISYRSVVIKLGSKPHGGLIDYVKKRILSFEIDTSHFLGKRYFLGKKGAHNRKKHYSEILIKGFKAKSIQLRRALNEIGVIEICSICNISSWNDKKINLEIDHIDGDNTNNIIENIRFICPNCHSQTNNYKFYNRKH